MKTKRFLKGNIDEQGYTYFKITNHEKKRTKISLHKMSYECFFGVVNSDLF